MAGSASATAASTASARGRYHDDPARGLRARPAANACATSGRPPPRAAVWAGRSSSASRRPPPARSARPAGGAFVASGLGDIGHKPGSSRGLSVLTMGCAAGNKRARHFAQQRVSRHTRTLPIARGREEPDARHDRVRPRRNDRGHRGRPDRGGECRVWRRWATRRRCARVRTTPPPFAAGGRCWTWRRRLGLRDGPLRRGGVSHPAGGLRAAIDTHTTLYPGRGGRDRRLRARGAATAICTNKPEAWPST
jgi:hypothetical protein